jgi:hypothetical protein
MGMTLGVGDATVDPLPGAGPPITQLSLLQQSDGWLQPWFGPLHDDTHVAPYPQSTPGQQPTSEHEPPYELHEPPASMGGGGGPPS